VICHHCGQDGVAGARCHSCGTALGKLCSSCSFANVAESRFCGGCGKALEEAQAEDALGERRQITCLFVDLVGSTELSQRLDPEDLRDLLADYQSVCNDAVEVHGGHIAQFLGDGIVIYFGYPRSHEDDAHRAVRCALDILEGIEHLNAGSEAVDPIRIRLGAHTGRVVVGPVGAGDRQDRIALGDTPNIAARLEGEAEVGTFVVSDTTWQLVERGFVGRSLGHRNLKGVERPMEVWVVERRSRSHDRVDVSAGASPFVGRSEELRRLEQIVGESRDTPRARFALLVGEAGLGKSRLARTVLDRVGSQGMTIRVARSTQQTVNLPFAPIRELLRSELALSAVADPVSAIEAMLDAAELRTDANVIHLADLLDVALTDTIERAPDSPARLRASRIQLLVDLLTRSAADSPTLLFLEDFHWADASTLECVERVVAASPDVPLTVLMAARPTIGDRWIADERIDLVDLQRLDGDAISTLATSVAGGKTLPRGLMREIIVRSDGIPLYVEELTRSAMKSDQLIEHAASWEVLGATDSGHVPVTVESSLTARIDSTGGSRATAQLAATIGREFDVRFLKMVSERTAETIDTDIATMLETGLVRQVDTDPNRLAFRHALIRDAAYNTLLRAARRSYHRRIAEAYQRWDEPVSPDELARHLQAAGDHAGAWPMWIAAAQGDMAYGSLIEATTHLSLAIGCLQALPSTDETKLAELEIQNQIWGLWAATEGWASANVLNACERGLALANELGRPDLLYGSFFGLWTVHFLRGEMDEALGVAEQVHAMADASGVPMIQVTGEHALGYTRLYRGELIEALEAADRALALFDLDQEQLIAQMFQLSSSVALRATRAESLYLLGRVRESDLEWEMLDRLARELEHPPSLEAALAFMIHGGKIRHGANDRLALLNPISDEMRATTGPEGSLLFQAVSRCLDASQLLDVERARAEMEAGLEAFLQTGSRLTEINIRVNFVETLLRLGDHESAERQLRHAEQGITERGERLMEPEVWRLRGRIAALAGRTTEAATAYDTSLALADEQRAVMFRLRTLLDRHEFDELADRGRVADEIREVCGRIDAPDDEPELVRAHRLIAATVSS
jgi:class 3 adenylate cyclase/tetratricopeptide (TPR) repeat protein